MYQYRSSLDRPSDWPTDPDSGDEDEADDPVCVCGVHLSEHSGCGCPEGFQTAASWKAERDLIYQMAAREADGEIEPGWEWWGDSYRG